MMRFPWSKTVAARVGRFEIRDFRLPARHHGPVEEGAQNFSFNDLVCRLGRCLTLDNRKSDSGSLGSRVTVVVGLD